MARAQLPAEQALLTITRVLAAAVLTAAAVHACTSLGSFARERGAAGRTSGVVARAATPKSAMASPARGIFTRRASCRALTQSQEPARRTGEGGNPPCHRGPQRS